MKYDDLSKSPYFAEERTKFKGDEWRRWEVSPMYTNRRRGEVLVYTGDMSSQCGKVIHRAFHKLDSFQWGLELEDGRVIYAKLHQDVPISLVRFECIEIEAL